MTASGRPLVSCVMPTADRRAFVPYAIRYFRRQTYGNRELVVVDDGAEPVDDLMPADDPSVRYVPLAKVATLGEKRNICAEVARGDLIMHWDDDDWMAPDRIAYQVEALLDAGAEVCGVDRMLFLEPATGAAWLYVYGAARPPWLAGGSLLYTRAFWRRFRFPHQQCASDTQLVWTADLTRRVTLSRYDFYVATIHPGNTSPKLRSGAFWSRWPGDLRAVMGDDLAAYDASWPRSGARGGRAKRLTAATRAASDLRERHLAVVGGDVPAPASTMPRAPAPKRADAGSSTLTVVVGVRAADDAPLRRRNALACLEALARRQRGIERAGYRVVVVEQDAVPRLEREMGALADRYVFAFNDGPYNRGWAFNIGAMLDGAEEGALCLIDADILVTPDFLRSGLAALAAGARAVVPFREILYLDRWSTERVLQDADTATALGGLTGERFRTSEGGCIFVDARLYREVGGHDERFRGWGAEDREFRARLALHTEIHRLGGCLLHLEHERPAETGPEAAANQRLYQALVAEGRRFNPGPIGRPERYQAVPEGAADRCRGGPNRKGITPIDRSAPRRPAAEVSVVIPHGGSERLPHLMATLATLRQCPDVAEIVVVDMGEAPVAAEAARRWRAGYVFVHNAGVFEKARAFNVGSGLAAAELVLWLDNDLLVPPGFVRTAAAELRAQRVDHLIPYDSIRYLSEADSQQVMTGVVGPDGCPPARTLYGGRDVSGGAGLVRMDFLRRYGGVCEEFRGWGGEDNGWLHKVRLLGRSGVTGRRDQVLYHLYHPNSGAFGSPHAANPHYGRNVELLREMHLLRRPEDFLRRFPSPGRFRPPWPVGRRVLFLSEAAPDSSSRRTAERAAREFADLFGIPVERAHASGDCADDRGLLAGNACDALVIFGTELGLRLLGDGSSMAARTVVVCERDAVGPGARERVGLSRAAAVLTADRTLARAVERAGGRAWSWPGDPADEPGGPRAAVALVQPLSILLGYPESRAPCRPVLPANGPQETTRRPPIWLYWEGECPAWIAACQQTIRMQAPTARLLTPERLDELWDRDRDIDLGRLCAAHRADFVRAFLLARYGGLWIDSDCILMRSLDPLLDALRDREFVAHQDRQGYFPNGLIGARPGSVIAADLYRRVCAVLRSGRPLGWTSLGGLPLTEILRATEVPWHQVACELIQPICWSDPGAFFVVDDDAGHERRVNERAFCYMLSNTSVQQYQAANRHRDLLADGTFFSFLVRRALGEARRPRAPTGATSPDGAAYRRIPFWIQAIRDVAPSSVLDASASVGRWGLLIREFCESDDARARGTPGLRIRLGGVARDGVHPSDGCRSLYDELFTGDATGLPGERDGAWDLVILDDVLRRWPRPTADAVLDRALALAPYVLVNTTVDLDRRHHDGAPGRGATDGVCFDLVDLLLREPVRYDVDDTPSACAGASFLLSREDPRGLGRSRSAEQPSGRVYEDGRLSEGDSARWPGSSLVQTAELRRCLPLLLAKLGARTLLDAACGDFRWMKEVTLGVAEYIGVDIVPELIRDNRERYGEEGRIFLCLDITRDLLPKADVILCRDCLVHYPFDDIRAALRSFGRSGATYVLMTTFTGPRDNREVAAGDWRPLNFERHPFHFPPPLRFINEKCTEAAGRYGDKGLGLWALRDLPFVAR